MNIEKLIITNPYLNKKDNIIRFKYYGEFDKIKHLHEHCDKDLVYIGNSNIDGSPIFNYYIDNINTDIIIDSKKLNIYIRKLKIKKYKKEELTKYEISILYFIEFLMYSLKEKLIKHASPYEIDYYNQ